MTSLSLVVLVSALSAGGTTYAEAYRQASETGRPLVILIGAEWCPACVTMKNSVIPQAQRQGVLKRVCYAEVNTDHEGALSQQLMRPGPIPQLIVFHKTADGWRRRELIGRQGVDTIEALIEEALRAQSNLASQPTAAAR
jgi:thioredoxin-like negative regulator of GroEL